MSYGKNIGSLIVDLLKFEKEQKEKGKAVLIAKNIRLWNVLIQKSVIQIMIDLILRGVIHNERKNK